MELDSLTLILNIAKIECDFEIFKNSKILLLKLLNLLLNKNTDIFSLILCYRNMDCKIEEALIFLPF